MDVEEKAVSWMEKTAKDSAHGYDQQYRWGEKGDYDCSSAVITAYQQAGVPVKDNGATYTGNMKHVFLKCGFKDVTSKVNLVSGAGLKRGDVLLNEVHHVAMYCGNGYAVEASVNENGHATGGKPGDQTGREFLIRPYRNFPWDCVLRYEGEKQSDGKNITAIANEVLSGKWGDGDERIKKLTEAGYDAGKVQKEVNRILGVGKKLDVDGYIGPKTVKALQKWLGTEQDGIISSQPEYTMNYLEAVQINAIEYVRTSVKGSDVVRALQRKLNIGVTGIFGKNTVQAIQNMLGVYADGYLGENTAEALQEYLNRL